MSLDENAIVLPIVAVFFFVGSVCIIVDTEQGLCWSDNGRGGWLLVAINNVVFVIVNFISSRSIRR